MTKFQDTQPDRSHVMHSTFDSMPSPHPGPITMHEPATINWVAVLVCGGYAAAIASLIASFWPEIKKVFA